MDLQFSICQHIKEYVVCIILNEGLSDYYRLKFILPYFMPNRFVAYGVVQKA